MQGERRSTCEVEAAALVRRVLGDVGARQGGLTVAVVVEAAAERPPMEFPVTVLNEI